MNAAVMWEYRKASIAIDMTQIQGMSDVDLEIAFIHELGHVLVAEMRDWSSDEKGRKHEEHVVEGLSRAFFWVRNAARKSKK